MEPISRREIEENRFRVCCLHPVIEILGGAMKMSGINRLCGYGTGMTIKEINKNLIWKGRPYIRIPYCKYCYNYNTVGVFDDDPRFVGWYIAPPTKKNPIFRLGKLDQATWARFLESYNKV